MQKSERLRAPRAEAHSTEDAFTNCRYGSRADRSRECSSSKVSSRMSTEADAARGEGEKDKGGKIQIRMLLAFKNADNNLMSLG